MTGREELQNALSLVDVTKVDLPSYNISTKKYDIIAKVYTKVLFLLSCLEVRVNQKATEGEVERLAIVKRVLDRISANPLIHYYDFAVQRENAYVQQATDDIYGSRVSENNPRMRVVQNSVKKSLMIKNMKRMLNYLQQFAECDQENTIEFCMSDENFEKQVKLYLEAQQEFVEEQNQKQIVEEPAVEAVAEQSTEVPKSKTVTVEKTSWLKRLFGGRKMTI